MTDTSTPSGQLAETTGRQVTTVQLRNAVALVAIGEENTKGGDKYWRVVLDPRWKGPYPRHWCGAFALWCLHQALGCKWIWDVYGCYGAKSSGFLHHLPRTEDPRVGDIAYKDKPYQHHAVVAALDGDWVITQDGNQGSAPGVCLATRHRKTSWTAFYSIEGLLK